MVMSTQASNEKLLNQASQIVADSAEFTVLHVSSTLNRSSLDINPDDPLTEEDTIECMLKADAVNLVEGKTKQLSGCASGFPSIPFFSPHTDLLACLKFFFCVVCTLICHAILIFRRIQCEVYT